MEFKAPMIFLGVTERISKRTNNTYYMAKFQNGETDEVFDFYVGERGLKEEVGVCKKYSSNELVLKLSSYNGQAKIDLIGVKNIG
jgi:hypothetical protein